MQQRLLPPSISILEADLLLWTGPKPEPLDSLGSRPRTKEGKEGEKKAERHPRFHSTLTFSPAALTGRRACWRYYPSSQSSPDQTRLHPCTDCQHHVNQCIDDNSRPLNLEKKETNQTFRCPTSKSGCIDYLLQGQVTFFVDLGALSIRLLPAFLSQPARTRPRSSISNTSYSGAEVGSQPFHRNGSRPGHGDCCRCEAETYLFNLDPGIACRSLAYHVRASTAKQLPAKSWPRKENRRARLTSHRSPVGAS